MRKLSLLVCVLLLLSVIGGSVVAQDGGDREEGFFIFVSDEPLMERGASGEWDDQYNLPAGAIVHEDKFYLFRLGLPGWPAAGSIGLLVSDDGLTWEELSEEPLITTEDVEFANTSIFGTSILQEEDGTWTLFFYTRDSGGWPLSSNGQIGRATADELAGPWTVYPEPILSRGEEGTWDDQQVTSPNVFITEDGYVMFYGGANSYSDFQIGRATSEDGFEWEKDSEPIITITEDWELGASQPSVQLTPDGYVMIYKGGASSGGLGLAFSEDGIEWEKYEDAPVLIGVRTSIRSSFDNATLLYHDETYYLYMEFSVSGGTNTYVAYHEGLIRDAE